MKTDSTAPKDIDDYIGGFSPEVQAILQKIRQTISKAVPDAQEKISYRIPAFALNGDVVYFAAFKKHIGLFPPVRGDKQLMKDVAIYAGEKGNLKFPLTEPIPYALIGRIAKARRTENLQRAAAQAKKKVRAKKQPRTR